MRAIPVTDTGSDKSLTLVSTLVQEQGHSCTKRIAELEARIAHLRSELVAAEAELERERTRIPAPGDFVRCPLTNFFGRVTRVMPRSQGRAWVEIIPYLGPDLPGHSAMDLFDSWELMDPPSEAGTCEELDGAPRLPTVAPFMPVTKPALSLKASEDEIETSLQRLWTRSSSSSF
jgi:hypothetical protein